MVRLTQREHTEIYAQKGKEKARALAEKYKVSQTTIYNIWKGVAPETYKEALIRIRTKVEKRRGLTMSTDMSTMWGSILQIIGEALKDENLPVKKEDIQP